MDPVIFIPVSNTTSKPKPKPKLKLTLLTTAERGSQELKWLHALHEDREATWWRYVCYIILLVLLLVLLGR